MNFVLDNSAATRLALPLKSHADTSYPRTMPPSLNAMSDLLKEIPHQARALSPGERAQLAEVMLESLLEGSSAEVDAAWDQELQTRIAAYEQGESKLVSAKDVFDSARRLTT